MTTFNITTFPQLRQIRPSSKIRMGAGLLTA